VPGFVVRGAEGFGAGLGRGLPAVVVVAVGAGAVCAGDRVTVEFVFFDEAFEPQPAAPREMTAKANATCVRTA